jgi:hypothetical protein
LIGPLVDVQRGPHIAAAAACDCHHVMRETRQRLLGY